MSPGPVLLIGLDAADLERVERLADAGDMPNLAAILRAGTRGRMSSRPAGLSATIWPKWFEGGHVGSRHFAKMWNPDRMCLEWTTATSGDPEPFWCDLDRRGLRVCVVDVPQAPLGPMQNGTLVQGWQVHDLFERGSVPSGLWTDLTRACGDPFLDTERYGPQTPASLSALRRQLLATSTQASDLARELMNRGPWDLFVMILGSLHRGGHYLWDLEQIDARRLPNDERRLLEDSLDDIYRLADRTVGQLVELAAAGTRIMVFSLHGMGPNHGWSECLQSFAGAVAGRDAVPARATALQKLKRLIPPESAMRAVDLLPGRLSQRVMEFTSSRLHDWTRTRWFVLPSDLNGFLRLNLRGREARGIVAPGAEARALEDELIQRFSRIEDLQGRRIVADVERTDDTIASDSQFRPQLPDLLLLWDYVSAAHTEGLNLDGREIARWPLGRPFSSGRSGNHVAQGWFAAVGPGLAPMRDESIHDIDVIVPTVYCWLGLEPPAQFVGQALDSVVPAGHRPLAPAAADLAAGFSPWDGGSPARGSSSRG